MAIRMLESGLKNLTVNDENEPPNGGSTHPKSKVSKCTCCYKSPLIVKGTIISHIWSRLQYSINHEPKSRKSLENGPAKQWRIQSYNKHHHFNYSTGARCTVQWRKHTITRKVRRDCTCAQQRGACSPAIIQSTTISNTCTKKAAPWNVRDWQAIREGEVWESLPGAGANIWVRLCTQGSTQERASTRQDRKTDPSGDRDSKQPTASQHLKALWSFPRQ